MDHGHETHLVSRARISCQGSSILVRLLSCSYIKLRQQQIDVTGVVVGHSPKDLLEVHLNQLFLSCQLVGEQESGVLRQRHSEGGAREQLGGKVLEKAAEAVHFKACSLTRNMNMTAKQSSSTF